MEFMKRSKSDFGTDLESEALHQVAIRNSLKRFYSIIHAIWSMNSAKGLTRAIHMRFPWTTIGSWKHLCHIIYLWTWSIPTVSLLLASSLLLNHSRSGIKPRTKRSGVEIVINFSRYISETAIFSIDKDNYQCWKAQSLPKLTQRERDWRDCFFRNDSV